MAKKHSERALPILAIVFSGVSMILFLVQIVFSVANYQIEKCYGPTDFVIMLLEVIAITLIALLPAIFFILCASKYLSGKKNKFLSASFIVLALSSLLLALSRIIGNKNFFNFTDIKSVLPEYIIAFSYLSIIILCLVAVIRLNSQKSFKVCAILAACCGFLIVVVMLCFSIASIVTGFSLDFASVLRACVKLASSVLYELAFVFLYIALIFTALPYGKKQKVKVTLKQSNAIEE